MSEKARWYVVHTYSGYENKVEANLEKAIENRNLEETLTRAWEILGNLPKGELTKIKDKNIEQYYKEGSKQ